jgi:hypothetical protein
MLLMKHQLFLAHFYYHHNPPGILTSTSAYSAVRDLWPRFMEGTYPEEGSAADNKLVRQVREWLTLHPPPVLLDQ